MICPKCSATVHGSACECGWSAQKPGRTYLVSWCDHEGCESAIRSPLGASLDPVCLWCREGRAWYCRTCKPEPSPTNTSRTHEVALGDAITSQGSM